MAYRDKELYNKVENGTWKEQDVYKAFKIDPDIDPITVAQNMSVEIEKMMGIYPNIPKLLNSEIANLLSNK